MDSRWPALKLILSGALGAAIFGALLAYVGFDKILRAFSPTSPALLLPCVAMNLASYWLRGIRWRLILGPGGSHLRSRDLFPAVVLGHFINSLIPIRVGEIARAALVSKRSGVNIFSGLSSIAAEKVLDVLSVICLASAPILLSPRGLELPPQLLAFAQALSAISAIALLAMPFAVRRRELLRRLFQGPLTRLPRIGRKIALAMESMIDGLSGMASPGSLSSAIALSFAIWALYALVGAAFLRAYGLGLPLSLSLLGMMVFTLSFALPAPPGYAGTFEFFWLLAFVPLGVGADEALAIGFAFHIFSLVLISALGSMVASWAGVSVADLASLKALDVDSRNPRNRDYKR
ncbi:MAG: lysylphosphatidylglycerol synthase transmembrane domain-containing protein [Candidatus Bathyarchaeia archaeon]